MLSESQKLYLMIESKKPRRNGVFNRENNLLIGSFVIGDSLSDFTVILEVFPEENL